MQPRPHNPHTASQPRAPPLAEPGNSLLRQRNIHPLFAQAATHADAAGALPPTHACRHKYRRRRPPEASPAVAPQPPSSHSQDLLARKRLPNIRHLARKPPTFDSSTNMPVRALLQHPFSTLLSSSLHPSHAAVGVAPAPLRASPSAASPAGATPHMLHSTSAPAPATTPRPTMQRELEHPTEGAACPMPCSRTHNCAHATTDTAYATLPARAPAPASVSAPHFLTDSRPHHHPSALAPPPARALATPTPPPLLHVSETSSAKCSPSVRCNPTEHGHLQAASQRRASAGAPAESQLSLRSLPSRCRHLRTDRRRALWSSPSPSSQKFVCMRRRPATHQRCCLPVSTNHIRQSR